MNGVDYLIFDERIKKFKKNSCGRLFLSGNGLSCGYINNNIENDRAFTMINNTLFYDTGDYVECGL